MKLLGVHLGPPSERELAGLLRQAEQSDPTYDYVGSLLASGPGGEVRATERRVRAELGSGQDTFERASEALRQWRPQRGFGAQIHPADAPIEEGVTVLVVLQIGPVAVVAPCRVVAVVDEPNRFGFAYGTLPGHAESGEESFLIERSESGTVTTTIRVDARPATLPARLASPAVSMIQRRALRRYLQAIQGHTASPSRG